MGNWGFYCILETKSREASTDHCEKPCCGRCESGGKGCTELQKESHMFEKTQVKAKSLYEKINESIQFHNRFLEFVKGFLIWHGGKLLSVAVFYASISPVSLFGFGYLISLVFVTNFPKTSHFPAKLYSSYTGILVACGYLFQMLGNPF